MLGLVTLVAFGGCAPARESQVPESLGCRMTEAGVVSDPVPRRRNAPPPPGPPSDLLVRARALKGTDDDRTAAHLFRRVIAGQGSDDAWNVEAAELDLAAVYHRAGAYRLAFFELESAAVDESHVMHRAALPWIVDMAIEDHANLPAIDLLYLYPRTDIDELGMARVDRSLVAFLYARALFRRGDYDTAMRALVPLERDTQLGDLASHCADLASHARSRRRQR